MKPILRLIYPSFYFPLLYLQEIIFTRISDCTQLVKLGVHACRIHAAPVQQGRRIVVDLFFVPGHESGHRHSTVRRYGKGGSGSSLAVQASLIGPMARRATFNCTTSRGETRPTATLEIIRSKSPICSASFQQLLHFGMAENIHYVLTLMDRFHILQGKQHQRRNIRDPIGNGSLCPAHPANSSPPRSSC